MKAGPVLLPQSACGGLGTPNDGRAAAVTPRQDAGSFGRILKDRMDQEGLKFSAHARKRLAERRIDLGGEDCRRLNQALDEARSKGVKETLLVYGDIALVASVPSRTVVTALPSGAGKVFTNIDGAVIVPR